MYYSSSNSAYPLQYHTCIPSQLKPSEQSAANFFVSPTLRKDLEQKTIASLQTQQGSNLPEYVHIYHSLVTIDVVRPNSKVFGHPTWTYKATSNRDGRIYCLRRIEGFRLTNEKSISIVQVWNTISAANVVTLHEAFTTRAFGDSSLLFVYDYHPKSKTLVEAHFAQDSGCPAVMAEKLIWGYASQLVSALKVIHSKGLAARLVEPSRILVTGQGHIRLNCCGIFDVLHYDHAHAVDVLQQEDIQKLGKLLLAMGNSSLVAAQNTDAALEYIEQYYSQGFKDLVHYILSPGTKSITEIIGIISEHLLESFNDAQVYTSVLEKELSQELENGRLVRLLSKFGLVTERPEYEKDPAWSEGGERYPIKLFRDYLFHHPSQETDSNGKTVISMGHMLKTLNKLDAGIDESIMLVSRDEETCIIMTYKEVCLFLKGITTC